MDNESRRLEFVRILSENGYGYVPPSPLKTEFGIKLSEKMYCSHALHETVEIKCDMPKGSFSFDADLFLPDGKKNVPVIVYASFAKSPYCKYVPGEEIIDSGVGFMTYYYNDVSTDDINEFDKLGECFDRDENTGFGKISLWVWAMSRCIDYLYTRDDVNLEKIGVCGHSRLGKTALWCGANDVRAKYVFANDSGCMGDALIATKKPDAESNKAISVRFPFWFCGNFNRMAQNDEPLPFDMDMLVGASCPRHVTVNSATLDAWADPPAQEDTVKLASRFWEENGFPPFVNSHEKFSMAEGTVTDGLSYFLRDGSHFMSRHDWLNDITVLKK